MGVKIIADDFWGCTNWLNIKDVKGCREMANHWQIWGFKNWPNIDDTEGNVENWPKSDNVIKNWIERD